MPPQDRPEVLWIGPHGSQDTSGEVIYDRKIAPALTAAANVSFYMPPRVGRLRKLLRLLRGQAWHWASYYTQQSLREMRAQARTADIVVCSWEKYDGFAEVVDRPVVLILHNIASDTARQVFPGDIFAQFMGWRTLVHEKRVYTRSNIKAILVLSLRDKRLLEEMGVRVPVLWAPPGTPSAVPLAQEAAFSPVLTFSGSCDWFPKRRDLGRFLQDVQTLGLSLESDETITEDIRHGVPITPARFTDPDHCAQTLRIGVIPDRFVAGHKLKAGFYISHNAIVLSYADIREEFAGLPHAEDFVRFVTGPEDLQVALKDFAARDSAALRDAFATFRAACVERFSWQTVSTMLRDEVLAAAAGEGSNAGEVSILR
jgi:hypothetical protein